MEQLTNLAKAVITTALRDLILNTPGNGFKPQGTPYIDKRDNILFSNITKKMIDINVVGWFESESRAQYSFLYWNDFAGLNPVPIKAYVKKLRMILEGAELEDEIINVSDLEKREIEANKKPERIEIASGYLPYARPTQKGKKWMNV